MPFWPVATGSAAGFLQQSEPPNPRVEGQSPMAYLIPSAYERTTMNDFSASRCTYLLVLPVFLAAVLVVVSSGKSGRRKARRSLRRMPDATSSGFKA